MDNDEAKFILRAYRPNGLDSGTPAFAEAIEQAQRDPSLKKWFEQEQGFDRAISAKLRTVAPPVGLRESILAGGKVSRRAPAVWWQNGSWIALAASVLIVFGAAIGWPIWTSRAENSHVAALAILDTLHGHHGNHGEATSRLEGFLENASTHVTSGELPVSMEELRSSGCRSLRFAGHDVVELCFFRQGKDYHLYVMSKLGRAPAEPKIFQENGGTAAQWSDARHSYVLATTASLSTLRDIL